MDKIAFRSFVRPFYRKTLGFWSLVLLLGGVFMEVKQHVLLGNFLFRNPLAFWILPISFLVFSLFHWTFLKSLLRGKNYELFHQLALFPKLAFRRFWIPVILANHGALLGYFLFLSYFGLEQQATSRFSVLWLVILGTLALHYLAILPLLRKPIRESTVRRPKVSWALPRFTWIILQLRQDRPLLFLLSKALSLLLLNGFFLSFLSGGYDYRWLKFGVLCVAFLQLPLLMEKSDFERLQQTWVLGLPITLRQKIGYHLGGLLLLVSPEMLFLMWNGGRKLTLPITFELMGLLAAIPLILQALIYYKIGSPKFIQWVLGTFFLLFLGNIFGLSSLWIIPAAVYVFIREIKSPFRI